MPTFPSHSICSPTVAGAIALAIAAAAAFAPAQNVVYTSRNGGNLAACGPLGAPFGQSTFLQPTATSDSFAFTHPGTATMPWSQASAQFDATPTANGISLAVAGSASRGGPPNAIWAYADGRDTWQFTITQPTHFSFTATLSASSTEATVPPQHFTFAGPIVPDPNTPPPPYQQTLSTPGTVSISASGTLLPGQYGINFFGRAEGTTFPYAGSYSNSLTLVFHGPTAANTRQAPGNPNSYTCTLPILGQTWNANVDVGSTGHGFAAIYASLTPGQVTLGPGLTLLLGGNVVQFLPVAPGPLANFAFSMPASSSFAGLPLFTQAVHFGTAPAPLLSNSQDLTLGF